MYTFTAKNTMRRLISYKKEFSSKDPQLMAERSGAVWHDGILKVIYCGQPVSVSYPDGQVSARRSAQPRGRNCYSAIPDLGKACSWVCWLSLGSLWYTTTGALQKRSYFGLCLPWPGGRI